MEIMRFFTDTVSTLANGESRHSAARATPNIRTI